MSKINSGHTRAIVSFLVTFLTFTGTIAQQGNKWYFGQRAGLGFDYNKTTPLTNGVLNTFEGTASICDENGNLLFYTDGISVYNRLHKQMPNGFGLKGDLSTYQSCIIVPRPGHSKIYYIFTADAVENEGKNGYNYSEVDMELANGLGDVTNIKNVPLSTPSSERLTAVMAGNFVDYWVITNDPNSNSFRVYKVNCDGVHLSPVVSKVGKTVDESIYANIGALKVSADGKWISQTNNHGSHVANPQREYAQLFRFDNNSGIVSSAMTIDVNGEGYYFGSEFSANSRILYFTNPKTNTIHQYDLSSGNAAGILSSKMIFPVAAGGVAAMQLGPDQKIYVANNTDKLHAIENPDNLGAACNFTENAADLSGRITILGLTSYVPNFFSNRPADFTYTILDSCKGEVRFSGVNRVANTEMQWDFGDGTISQQRNPVHTFPNPSALYYIKLRLTNDIDVGCGDYVTGKEIVPGGAHLEAKFGILTDCINRSITILDSSTTSLTNVSFHWNFGDGTTSLERMPDHIYTNIGDYKVQLIISGACASDTFSQPVKFNLPSVNAGPDLEVLPGKTTRLRVTGASRYEWSPGTYLNNANSPDPLVAPLDDITYFVTGFGTDGCAATDTINIKVLKNTLIEVPTAFTPNSDGLNDRLKPLLYNIRELDHFVVFNRWGQKIYETKTIGEGWDGTIAGKPQDSGTYVWILKVKDNSGQVVSKKGRSTLIR